MRVAIIGSSGSGKSTLARRVTERTGWPHIEIDRFYHLADWTPQDRDVLRCQLASELDQRHWVCDGNYQNSVGDLVRSEAEVIVVYELPRHVVMRQLVWRTVRRAVTREQLWNGNREPITNFTRWDPSKNIIRWSWVHHDEYSRAHRLAARSGQWAHADIVWIRRHADAEQWLESLPAR